MVLDTMEFTANEHQGPLRRGFRRLAAFLLGGLTSMEVLALSLGFVAVVGLLWATDSVAPEALVTNTWLRAGWALAVVGVLRPVTWIPYVLALTGIRQLGRWISRKPAGMVVNGLANVGALIILALAFELVFNAIGNATRWTGSVLGLLTGTVGFSGLGTDTGTWDAARIGAVVAAFVLLRPVIPPLGLDLDLAARPMLGFVDGGRGRFDRWLIGAAAVGALVSAGVSGFLALRGR